MSFAALLERFPALDRLRIFPPPSIPFVQQLTATECGLACLAMVLRHHGREVGLDRLRELCPASRDGASAADLLEVASKFQLGGRGLRLEPEDLRALSPGSILHWGFDHFVVFRDVRGDRVRIVDPGVGPRSLPMPEVRRAFTGIALEFQPTDVFVREKRKSVLLASLRNLVAESGLLGRILLLSLVLQAFGLALPILTGQLIDRVLPRGDQGLLTLLLLGAGAVVLFDTLARVVRGHLMLHLRTLLDTRLTLGFLDHLVRLPRAFFQQRDAGDLLMRLNSNTTVRQVLTSTVISGLLDGLMVILYLAILALGNGPMTMAALTTGALHVLMFLLVRSRQRDLTSEELAAQARSQSYETELLTSMETVKATASEGHAVSHWSNLFVDAMNVRIQRECLGIKTDAVVGALRLLGPLAVLAVGAREVLEGRLSLGAMVALSALAGSLLGPLGNVIQQLLCLETVRGYIDRVNDVLEAEPEQPVDSIRAAKRLAGAVSLENVSFRYAPGGPLVVCDASFEVRPGQFVAIVGRSGSGKTTLANLLLGLYPPCGGRVRFDGTDLGQLDLRSVRRQLGVVNQNLDLFGASIRQNITMGDPGLTLAEVEAAARLACIHDEIVGFPMGYETRLLDRGGSVSGGQKQRLALARALVRNPAILLMDEATSALDAETEARLQRSLEGLACTRIVIAHRLSTVRNADLILVVDQGRIVERGTHDRLTSAGGVYTSLVSAQLLGAAASPAGPPPPP